MLSAIRPRYPIRIDEVPDEVIASIRTTTPRRCMAEAIDGAFGALGEALADAGAFGHGPPGVIVHDQRHRAMILEVFVPVSRLLRSPPGVAVRVLRGGRVATTTHDGPYAQIGHAYRAVHAWIADHRRVPAGPPRERYVGDGAAGRDGGVVRIEFPIA